MTLATILAFAAIAALLIMSPGPNGVLIARTVPTSGRAAGFANIAGFVAAFFVHGTFAIFGLSVLLLQSAHLFTAVKLAGAAYLVWIGLKALRDAWRGLPAALVAVEPAKRRRTLLKAFGEGFLTNALNPKVAMFYVAAFPQFMPHDGARRLQPICSSPSMRASTSRGSLRSCFCSTVFPPSPAAVASSAG